MSLRGYGNKRDLTEKEIVDFLKSRGCKVYRLDRPVDLLVGLAKQHTEFVSDVRILRYERVWVLAEVKTGNGKLTPLQIEFIEDCKGWPIHILRTIDDAKDMLSFYGVTE